ncbi:hypothetical protein [Streptomyces albidoflavus]|uniref:hypothetical protein n=1 Tax=Streptomyces albidoflavus TaxID=1886 RepID=UPI0033CBE1D5
MNHSHAAPGTTRMTPHRARPPRRGDTKYPLSPATVRVLRWGRWFSLTLAVLTWAVVITALVTGSWGADLFLLVTNAVGAVLWPAHAAWSFHALRRHRAAMAAAGAVDHADRTDAVV